MPPTRLIAPTLLACVLAACGSERSTAPIPTTGTHASLDRFSAGAPSVAASVNAPGTSGAKGGAGQTYVLATVNGHPLPYLLWSFTGAGDTAFTNTLYVVADTAVIDRATRTYHETLVGQVNYGWGPFTWTVPSAGFYTQTGTSYTFTDTTSWSQNKVSTGTLQHGKLTLISTLFFFPTDTLVFDPRH